MTWQLALRFSDEEWPGTLRIVDMQDYERTQATLRLMNELAKGRKSGEEKAG